MSRADAALRGGELSLHCLRQGMGRGERADHHRELVNPAILVEVQEVAARDLSAVHGGGDDAGLPPGDPHNVNQHASEREPEGNDRWQRARAARLNLDEPTNAALAKNTSLVVR